MAKQPFENVVHYLFEIAARAEFKTLTDRELLKRYVDHRDDLAFGELVRRYKSIIWYVCWRVLRHHQDVEDAFQATLLTIVRRAKKLLGHAVIEGWIHSTAFRVASNTKIERQRRRAREERNAKMYREKYEIHDCRWKLEEVLDKELTRVPEKLRSALILCYLEGMTQHEAAEKLGVSVDAVDHRLRRGRECLKKRLSKYGIEFCPTMMMAHAATGANAPEVPDGLVEKTLEIVRIMSLTDATLETAGVSTPVAILVKGAMGMTLKMKLLLGSMLLLSFVVATAGAAKYAGILHAPLEGQRHDGKSAPANKVPDEPTGKKTLLRKDLYGDLLPPSALARLGTVRFRPSYDSISDKALMFTPDGKELMTASSEHIHFWNRETGKLVRQLDYPTKAGQRENAIFSHDGKLWGSQRVFSKPLILWDMDTSKVVCELETQQGCRQRSELKSWTFSPDSKSILTSYSCGEGTPCEAHAHLVLWDITTRQKRWEVKEQNKAFRLAHSLAISADGKFVAVEGICVQKDRNGKTEKRTKNVLLCNGRTGQPLRTLGYPLETGGPRALSFSPDGSILLVDYANQVNGDRSCVHAFDVTTGKEIWGISIPPIIFWYPPFPTFSPDGKIVAVTRNREILLLESTTGKKIRTCHTDLEEPGHSPMAFSPDGKALARMYGPMIRCWDVATGRILPPPPTIGHESGVSSVAFAGDGSTLISGSNNQAVHIWDTRTAQRNRTLREESRVRKLRSWNIMKGALVGATASQDGRVVAGKCIEVPRENDKAVISTICCWDTVTRRRICKLPIHGQFLAKLVLAPDGKFLAVSDFDFTGKGKVSVWEVATSKRIELGEGKDPIFSSDGTLLMVEKEGQYSFWEVATGRKVAVSPAPNISKVDWFDPPIAVSPDWQILARRSHRIEKEKRRAGARVIQTIDLYPLYKDHQWVRFGPRRSVDCPLTTSSVGVTSLALSADGKMLAWAGKDAGRYWGTGDDRENIHVCETATGKERVCFSGHKDRVRALSFSPDGRRLASGSDDSTILIWDVTEGCLDDQGHLRPVRLSAQQVEELWTALCDTDGVRAGKTVWILAAAPNVTVPFFAKHLSRIPVDHALAQRIEGLITELDNEKFAVRKKAAEELEKLGAAAESTLRQALAKQLPVEVRKRLQQLLAVIENQSQVPSMEEIRVVRAIEILEQIGNQEAQQLLERLGQGAPGVRQTEEARAALNRLKQWATR